MKLLFYYFIISILCIPIFTSGIENKINESDYLDSLEANISGTSDILPILTNKLNEFNKQGDSIQSAKVCYVIGKYYIIRTFNYPQAYNYFFRALTNFDNSGNKNEIGKCEMQIGLIYHLQRNFNEAENYFNSAFNKMVETNDSMRIGRIAYLLGLTYTENNDLEKAMHFLQIAKISADKNSYPQAAIEYNYGMGIYYLNKKNGDSALYYLEPVLKNAEASNNTAGIQIYSSQIAKAWELKNNPGKTEYFCNKVLSTGINNNTNSAYAFINCHHLLYEIALKKGDYKNAVTHLNKYVLLKDSLLNEKSLFEIASLKTKFTVEKNLQQRDLLEAKKAAEQNQLLEKQKSINIIYLIGSIFLFIIVTILIFANNLKKKKNLQLAETINKLKSTQQQLVHQEKLASMGKLSAGIAHEMRNPLNFVNNYSELTSEMLDELVNVNSNFERSEIINNMKSNVTKISEHGKRVQTIVNQIIEHVHPSTGIRELTDLRILCDSYLKIVLQTMSMNKIIFHHEIIRNYQPGIPLISVSQQEFGRVMINIFANAFQAIEEKLINVNFLPVISINITFENKTFLISVEDNGIGIKKELIHKIAEPFFTTRPPGKGAGLGLSIANDIVKSYGGSINVVSEELVKTKVTIQIPI